MTTHVPKLDGTIIAIVGKGGSGKDYMTNLIVKNFVSRKAVFHTTRPARIGEVDGKDYHFVKEVPKSGMLTVDTFLDCDYGLSESEITSDTSGIIAERGFTVVILTPKGVKDLRKKLSKNRRLVVVYLAISERIRRARLLKREDVHDSDVERRIFADDRDFKDFKVFNVLMTDPQTTHEGILGSVVSFLSHGESYSKPGWCRLLCCGV